MLTDGHLEAMKEGRQRFLVEKRERAIQRVKVYRDWLAAGSVVRDVPEIPSDADFRAASEP